MRKGELEAFHAIDSITADSSLLKEGAKTPQQHYFLTATAIQLYRQGHKAPLADALQSPLNGSFSQLMLNVSALKNCIESKTDTDNPHFRVLNTLIHWMEKVDDFKKVEKPQLLEGILLPKPQKMLLYHAQEFITYLNYIAADLQSITRKPCDTGELLQLLELALPKIYYNIILPPEKEGQRSREVLFFDHSMQYFCRTRPHYQVFCRNLIQLILKVPDLTQQQSRDLLEKASRYYLLFWKQNKLAAVDVFEAVAKKTSQAVKFALSDELILFFKIANKIGSHSLQKKLEGQEWVANLLQKLQGDAVIGMIKQQVFPFNTLGLKQIIHIESGSRSQRVIEIYQQNSLFYYTVLVENHDIGLSLFYLGDFQSKVEVKKELIASHKVTGNSNSAFIASKKGIYAIELDNTFSWVNSKNVRFECVVLSPFEHAENPHWLNTLFEIGNKNDSEQQQIKVEIEDNRPKQKQKAQKQQKPAPVVPNKQYEDEQLQEESSLGFEQQNPLPKVRLPAKEPAPQQVALPTQQKEPSTQPQQGKKEVVAPNKQVSSSEYLETAHEVSTKHANLTLIQGIFSLLVTSEDHTYEFETNLEDRIEQRLHSYCRDNQLIQWVFNAGAKDWVRRRGFYVTSRGGSNVLSTVPLPEKKSSRVGK